MTGAPMPAGADTVYPQEIVERVGARVRIAASPKGVNVRLRGEDVEAGGVVVEAGTVLRPQELGLITSLGLSQVLVQQRPRVALLSTGDEVAEPGTPRKPGQIYDSNRFALRGLAQAAAEVIDLGIVPDVRESCARSCSEASAMADVVITSGGVSVGRLRPRQGRARARSAASISGRWRCSRAVRSRSAASAARTSSGCPAIRSPRC